MTKTNPCDICSHRFCDDCILYRTVYPHLECPVYECFLNYDGNCALNLSADCECRKEKKE